MVKVLGSTTMLTLARWVPIWHFCVTMFAKREVVTSKPTAVAAINSNETFDGDMGSAPVRGGPEAAWLFTCGRTRGRAGGWPSGSHHTNESLAWVQRMVWWSK